MTSGDHHLHNNNRREEGLLHVLCEHGVLHRVCEVEVHRHQCGIEVLRQRDREVPRGRYGLGLLLLDHENGLRRLNSVNHPHRGLRSLIVLPRVERVIVR